MNLIRAQWKTQTKLTAIAYRVGHKKAVSNRISSLGEILTNFENY